jgi:hypothetical protein
MNSPAPAPTPIRCGRVARISDLSVQAYGEEGLMNAEAFQKKSLNSLKSLSKFRSS